MDKTGYSAPDNTELDIMFDLIEHIECHNVNHNPSCPSYFASTVIYWALSLQQIHDEQTGVSTMLKLVSRLKLSDCKKYQNEGFHAHFRFAQQMISSILAQAL